MSWFDGNAFWSALGGGLAAAAAAVGASPIINRRTEQRRHREALYEGLPGLVRLNDQFERSLKLEQLHPHAALAGKEVHREFHKLQELSGSAATPQELQVFKADVKRVFNLVGGTLERWLRSKED